MAKRPAPSAVPSGASRRVDVRAWLGANRLGGFTVIMLILVVLAAFVLVPTASTYVQQRQRIDALKHAVQVSQEQIDALDAERDRWDDDAYIVAQARERLFYVMPGEVAYLIVDDLDETDEPTDQAPVSSEVTESDGHWTSTLLQSVIGAGVAGNATGGDG
ncbi:MAG: septum formation initiator family protein [Microbacterium sp.]